MAQPFKYHLTIDRAAIDSLFDEGVPCFHVTRIPPGILLFIAPSSEDADEWVRLADLLDGSIIKAAPVILSE